MVWQVGSFLPTLRDEAAKDGAPEHPAKKQILHFRFAPGQDDKQNNRNGKVLRLRRKMTTKNTKKRSRVLTRDTPFFVR